VQQLHLAGALQHHDAHRLAGVRGIGQARLELAHDRLGLDPVAQPGRAALGRAPST
jgi:hypothetical protein